MNSVPSSKPRYTIEDSFAALRITIPARRSWAIILFLGFWLTGWAGGELFAGATLIRGLVALLSGESLESAGEQIGGLFLVVWLALWTVGGGFALAMWLWNLAGKEIVFIDGEALTIRKAVFGIGRTKKFAAGYVDRLRAADEQGNAQGPWSGGLSFDYGGSTVRFGAGLSRMDAHELVARISDRFPALAKGME